MRARLTITIDYDDASLETGDERYIRDLLKHAADHLAAHGLFTGDSPIELDQWESEVELHVQ